MHVSFNFRYVEGVVGNAEGAWHLSDQFDGFDWEGMVRGKQFVFFQGLDSPGGDYLVVEGGGVERVREACLSTRHCLGFNTNGILKDSLRPPSGWIQWAGPEYPEHGLYVLGEFNFGLPLQYVCKQLGQLRTTTLNSTVIPSCFVAPKVTCTFVV